MTLPSRAFPRIPHGSHLFTSLPRTPRRQPGCPENSSEYSDQNTRWAAIRSHVYSNAPRGTLPIVGSMAYILYLRYTALDVMYFLTHLLTIALGLTSISSKPTNSCRCTFGSACWPSDSDFQTLASKLSQPLIRPVPPATPCYNSAAGNCTEVQASWFNGVWRSDQSGAAEHTNWETFTFPNGTIQGCYLNTSLGFPCQQGSVPVIAVDARTPGDVQEAVNFAGNHNLRLVIKNTG